VARKALGAGDVAEIEAFIATGGTTNIVISVKTGAMLDVTATETNTLESAATETNEIESATAETNMMESAATETNTADAVGTEGES